jgi:hypothetical protein
MSLRNTVLLLAGSLLLIILAGLVLHRPPWPGAGNIDKLRIPDSLFSAVPIAPEEGDKR